MNNSNNNIFPVFNNIISKENKEKQLKQKAKVIWMTGLSGSGKTTIAIEVEKILSKKGYLVQILDGDNIRVGISNNLSFSDEDRLENIRRISEVSKLFINCGVITINCFVSPSNKIRQQAKEIIGEENFIGVFINTDLNTCEKRDTKGLYKKARKGEIDNFTGISSKFEIPDSTYVNINTSNSSINKCVNQLIEVILPKIQHN
jgi:adenylylsulfate kinase|tara:strand:- start:2190 stop:2798 length:609 start_codon:yes stop_codon:yes gene_type:complete